MVRTRTKTKATNLPVPQNDEDARAIIKEIGDQSRELLRLEAELNDKVATLKKEYGDRSDPINERLGALKDGLAMFAEANRDRLTRGGKVKYHDFATGKISWRLKPAKVSVRGVADVIDALKAAGLHRFIRTKEELNKDAMLEERAVAGAIKGVRIGSDGEEFIVEPSETELTEAA